MAFCLFAQERGGWTVDTTNGELGRVETWWSPQPRWLGRWWWRDNSIGSAWFRAGAFQCGPLEAGWGGEGLRSWHASTDTTSGRWGAAWLDQNWGVWAVQTPDQFESGAQSRADWGPTSWRLGGARTWSLERVEAVPTDSFRAGAVLSSSWWRLSDDVLLTKQGAEDLKGTQNVRAILRLRSWQLWGAWHQDRWLTFAGSPSAGMIGRWRTWVSSLHFDSAYQSSASLRCSEFPGLRNLSMGGDVHVSKKGWGGAVSAGWECPWWASAALITEEVRWESSLSSLLECLWTKGSWSAKVSWKTELGTLGWFGPLSTVALSLSKAW